MNYKLNLSLDRPRPSIQIQRNILHFTEVVNLGLCISFAPVL